MITAGRLDLTVDRQVPFSLRFRIAGLNLVGATLRSQIRLYPGAPDAPLIDLTLPAGANQQGVYVDSIGIEDGVTVTYLGMRIDAATLAALPRAGELGDDVVFAWDMIVTPVGQDAGVWFAGRFIVREGVTVHG